MAQWPGMASAVIDATGSPAGSSMVPMQVAGGAAPTEVGGNQWMARYVVELGRPPDSAEQLRAFAVHRGGRLSYGEARRVFTAQHPEGLGASVVGPTRAEGAMPATPPEPPDWRAVVVERRRLRLQRGLTASMAIAEAKARASCKRLLALLAPVEPLPEEVCAICLGEAWEEQVPDTGNPTRCSLDTTAPSEPQRGRWRIIPCGHKYHEECLIELANRPGNCTCPLCRFDLRAMAV